jgi:DNA-binding MarR family transcriptional regulator/AcrR family transcriptional regulator
VVARAGVSREAFDRVFESPEDCILAAFCEGLKLLSRAMLEATYREERWLERLRAGLVALLGFLDDEPRWARLLILRAPVDAKVALECQHRLHDTLGALLREGRGKQIASAELGSPVLTGELVLGGVFSLIRTRMLEGDRGALVELAPALTAFIVASYLGLPVAKVELSETSAADGEPPSPSGELPILFTHRTTLVLRAIAATPRSSNAAIARAAGLTDEGQMSKLLKRLEHRGLIEHVTPERGSRRLKAWLITPTGRRVLLSFGNDPDSPPPGQPDQRALEPA